MGTVSEALQVVNARRIHSWRDSSLNRTTQVPAEEGTLTLEESIATATEVMRELILAGVPDEVLIQALAPHVEQGETAERLITELLKQDHHIPSEVRVQAQVRWYRRAIEVGHLWALYEAGSLWGGSGSQHSDRILRPGVPSGEENVSSEEARQWVIQAAEQGHRRACLDAALRNLEDARAVGWLRVFYGDGTFVHEAPSPRYTQGSQNSFYRDKSFDRVELAVAALWLARLLDKAGDPEAGDWYRISALCPPWSAPDILYGESWIQAASEYALWEHKQDNPDLCAAWAFRVLENAANKGPSDRSYMASEYKTYRNSWQLTLREEAARVNVMWHLLEEHDLPEWQRMDIALLLTNSWGFGQDESERIRGDLSDQVIQSLTLSQLLPVTTQRIQGLEVPINAKHAWAAVRWLLTEAVPAAFRFAGLEDVAADFLRLVPDDLKGVTSWEWMSAAENFEGWPHMYRSNPGDGTSQPWDYSSFERIANQWIRDLTDRAGLGERRSLFQTAWPPKNEDWLEEDLHAMRWRLLRGQQAWLGMYCATANVGEAEAWIAWWDDASRLVVFALQGALRSLCYDKGTDWLANAAFPYNQWSALKDAYKLSFTTFVDQATALN